MRLTFAVTFLALCGCSVYVPLNPDTPPPAGTDVRARLTTPGAVRVSDIVGSPVREIEGEILSFWGDSLGLSLMATSEYGRPWDSMDTLKLGTLEIMQLDEKRLDKRRTAFLVGGVGVITGVVTAALFKAATGSDDGESPGDIDAILIPLFSIRR
jgi:hypothetical protein